MDDRDSRFDETKRDEARRLYRDEKLSERAVAEKMGLSKSRVRDLLDDANVRRRSLKTAQKQRRSRERAGRR